MQINVGIYFKSDIGESQNHFTSFAMEANNVEEVVQMFLNTKGNQAVNLTNGYRIINFDNVCYMDIVAEEEEEEILLDAQG